MGDFNETREGSLGDKFRVALNLFAEQQSLLQSAVVQYRTEHQADMRQVREELIQLRNIVINGQMSTEALSTIRYTTDKLQQQHEKECDRFMMLFDRLSLNPPTTAAAPSSQVTVKQPLAASTPVQTMVAPTPLQQQQPPSAFNNAGAPPLYAQSAVQLPQPTPLSAISKPPVAAASPSQLLAAAPPSVVATPPTAAIIKQPPQSSPLEMPATSTPQQTSNVDKPGFLKQGEWSCSCCYCSNPASTTTCLACKALKPGTQAAVKPPAQAAPASAFTSTGFSFLSKPADSGKTTPVSTQQPAPAAPPTTTTASKPVSFSFMAPAASTAASTIATSAASNASGGLFSAASAGQKTLFGAPTGGGMTFGTVAQGTTTGASFLNKTGSNAGSFTADPKQFSLFGGSGQTTKPASTNKPLNASASRVDGDDDAAANDETAPESFVPDDSQFIRPNVELPSLVETRTGEEDEEALFQKRARIYRYVPETKEVKERGTGEIKVLKHKATQKLRVLMRREQTYKLCANFSIGTEFQPTYSKGKDNTLVWQCMDFSETEEKPEGEALTLICRFTDAASAAEFQRLVTSSA